MSSRSLIQAISDVKEVQERVVRAQLFRGYSGTARVTGGMLALLGALLMSQPQYPATPKAHLFGWAIICLSAGAVNYGALLCWFIRLPDKKRTFLRLRPAFDSLPSLLVAAILTLVLLQAQQEHVLFGVWMCLFGLVNLSARQSLPKVVELLGWYYIAAGILYLLVWPNPQVVDPWPMGAVFFVGEAVGGYVLYQQRSAEMRGVRYDEGT